MKGVSFTNRVFVDGTKFHPRNKPTRGNTHTRIPCEGTDPAKDHIITREEMGIIQLQAKECPGMSRMAATSRNTGKTRSFPYRCPRGSGSATPWFQTFGFQN